MDMSDFLLEYVFPFFITVFAILLTVLLFCLIPVAIDEAKNGSCNCVVEKIGGQK